MELQSVSAGAGKTFHLAKIFIRDFLTLHSDVDASHAGKDDLVWEGTVRRYLLREPDRIHDAHSHILAITFTNKATNEMKERIVDKLADLARGHQLKKTKDGTYKEAEYMAFFLNETYTADGSHPTRNQVMATAKAALSELLNSYTDFNISTIDAFFQQLLRTFAYELDLNDNLELELDNDYLAGVGVDMTLRSANRLSDPHHLKAMNWLRQLIANCQDRAAKWDILPSRASSDTGLHKELSSIAKKALGEGMKSTLTELRKYFRSTDWKGTGLSGSECFSRYYDETCQYYKKKIEKAFERLNKAVADFDAAVAHHGVTPDNFNKNAYSVVNNHRIDSIDNIPSRPKTVTFAKMAADAPDVAVVFNSKSKLSPEIKMTVGIAALETARAALDLYNLREVAANVTGKLFYVGLLGMISDNMESFRENNNLLPLSDTNTILNRIVKSQEDAPFIFERMGAMLHHFLIDEFQDTSTSQWDVMRPLLENADSQSFDNLIIGDAKQSIYRFRYAEPELITTGVQHDFPYTNKRSALMPNMNWRSSRTVVDFNNTLFRIFAECVDDSITMRSGFHRHSPLPIYRNVAQKIHHHDKEGFVQITFDDTDEYVSGLGDMIASLIDRGWKQRDIAVLCDLNSECHQVIDSLMAYNRQTNGVKLEIVSEEALSVTESTAVKMILAVLSLVAEGNLLPSDKDKRFSQQTVEIYATTQVASGRVSDPTEIDPAGLAGVISPEKVDAMLAAMPAISLPALVDAIVASPDFIPKKLRSTEAAYIAAFQDTVLDFCDRYPSDPASFMEWWKESGYKVNVAAPEGTDAISVMTVHKSKGLEFGAVIVPMANWDIDISKRDKSVIWVKPDPDTCSDERIMPPAVPIDVGSKAHEMATSPYAARYLEEYDRSRIDKLNEAYVAFTRAGGELYINAEVSDSAKKELSKGKPSNSASLGVYLLRFAREMADKYPEKYNFSDDEVFTAGTQGVAAGYPDFHKKDSKTGEGDVVKEYYVNAPMPKLRAVAGDDEQGKVGSPQEAPRSYGVQLHDVMCGMVRPRDLERSILRLRVKGLLDGSVADRCRRRIKEALALLQVQEWFAEGVNVLNERSILIRGTRGGRADRVVDNGKEIIVIDYKTGSESHLSEYMTQVRKYMRLYEHICRKSSMDRTVRGYILFIPADSNRNCSVVEVPREARKGV